MGAPLNNRSEELLRSRERTICVSSEGQPRQPKYRTAMAHGSHGAWQPWPKAVLAVEASTMIRHAVGCDGTGLHQHFV